MIDLIPYKNYIIAIVVAILMGFSYYKGYNSGYDNGYNKGYDIGLDTGIKQEKSRLDIEYNIILSEKLKKNTELLTKQFDIQLEAEKQDI